MKKSDSWRCEDDDDAVHLKYSVDQCLQAKIRLSMECDSLLLLHGRRKCPTDCHLVPTLE